MSDYEKDPASGGEEAKEKYDDRDVHLKTPVFEKASDFLSYHKGKVIAAVIVVLVLVFAVWQFIAKAENATDVKIAYSGSGYLDGGEIAEIQNLMSVALRKATGNEEVTVGFTPQYTVYSKEQIESIRAETNEDGEPNFVNSELNSENYDTFYEYLMTGETAIFFLEPWLYSELCRKDILVPMSELFDSVPPSVDEEGYGILLAETEIYDYYGVMQNIPENTVMCFLKPYVFGNTSNDNAYALMKDAFRSIVNFEAPQ